MSNANQPIYQLYELLPESNGNIIGVAEAGTGYDIVAFSLDNFFVTGVNDAGKEKQSLNIFPNPASENFETTMPSDINSRQILIADVNGKIIYSNSVSSQTKFSVDASSFPNGIYSIQADSKEKLAVGKLIVHH